MVLKTGLAKLGQQKFSVAKAGGHKLSSAESGASKMSAGKGADTPVWDFSQLEPRIQGWIEELKQCIDSLKSMLGDDTENIVLENITALESIVETIDRIVGLASQLGSYAYCRYSVETGNADWIRLMNSLEEITIPLSGLQARFGILLRILFYSVGIGNNREDIARFLEQAEQGALIRDVPYFLQLTIENAQYQMSPEQEDLASDLQRSAGSAWDRLQSTLMSELSAVWNPVSGEVKTMVELRNCAYSESRHVRKKAFNLELKLLEENKTAFAASLNGVKGNSLVLYDRRGYSSFLQPSILSSHINEATLDSLIGAMEASLPLFRRYFKAKAGLLGLKKMAFYDLFASIPGSAPKYTFSEAREFIVEQFSGFSNGLGSFAQRAFNDGWIDARPRAGKIAGAYMTDLPLTEEARVMANFDGSFNAVSTLAHELGHAYHNTQLEGMPYLNRDYPMTLAETASIFCETIVYNAAIENAVPAEKTAIIENLLMGAGQVIVDILSRFYFEREVFTRRKKGELSPEEFCEIMASAQKKTYGDSLVETELHPYMWAVKTHYYNTDLAFYNYPYAFGLLFALGLYAEYKAEPAGFPESYNWILQNTATMSAVELCAEKGFNIESPQFWHNGLNSLEPYIEVLESNS